MKRILLEWPRSKLKAVDMFSKPISLTYKRQHSFGSLYGGIVTLGLTTFLLCYGIILSIQMFTRSATSKSKNSILKDHVTNSEYYSFDSSELSFAVHIIDREAFESIADPTYFNVTVTQMIDKYDESTYKFINSNKSYPISICGDRYPKVNPLIDSLSGAFKNVSYCPERSDFVVGGSPYQEDETKAVEISVKKCANGTSIICQPLSVINAKAKISSVFLVISTKYFDFEDYSEPVKRVLDERNYLSMAPGIVKTMGLFLRKNKVSLMDSILPFSNTEESTFFSLSTRYNDFEFEKDSSDTNLIRILLEQDPIVDSYERRVYTFLDFSGQLGGFFEILVILGGIIVNHFSSKLYNYSMFNKLYCVDQRDLNEKSINAEVAPKSKVPDNEISKEYISKNNSNSSSINFNKSNDSECKKSQDSGLLQKVKHKLSFQRRYNFTAKEYIKSCIPFIANKSKRQFTALSDRFSDECDLPSILRSIRQLKTMMHLVLSEHQILLMGFDARVGVRYNSRVEISPMTPGMPKVCFKVDMPPVGEARSNSFSEKIENLISKLKEVSREQLSKDAATILGIDTLQENEVSAKHETVTKDKSFSKVGLIEEQKENVDWAEYPVKSFKDI
ncbi:unnamed protein product [Moneuplotes crassus]|uniref:Uncharacterized protein n=1 Tax=Euplotes crassus TaxID=5936 RepID=A0AAD1UAZ0_EUPCR|nr:unnamed protein product [Moneuplotes crassus]